MCVQQANIFMKRVYVSLLYLSDNEHEILSIHRIKQQRNTSPNPMD